MRLSDFLTSGQAPWWATGVFVILGSIVGAVVANALARRSDARKAAREETALNQSKVSAEKELAASLVSEYVGMCMHFGAVYTTERVKWVETYPDWRQLRENIGSKRQRQARVAWAEHSKVLNPLTSDLIKMLTRIQLLDIEGLGEGAGTLFEACNDLIHDQADDDFFTQTYRLQHLVHGYVAMTGSLISSYPDGNSQHQWELLAEMHDQMPLWMEQGVHEEEIERRIRQMDRADALARDLRDIYGHMNTMGASSATFTVILNEDMSADVMSFAPLDGDLAAVEEVPDGEEPEDDAVVPDR